jgi:hypothetical protein
MRVSWCRTVCRQISLGTQKRRAASIGPPFLPAGLKRLTGAAQVIADIRAKHALTQQ